MKRNNTKENCNECGNEVEEEIDVNKREMTETRMKWEEG